MKRLASLLAAGWLAACAMPSPNPAQRGCADDPNTPFDAPQCAPAMTSTPVTVAADSEVQAAPPAADARAAAGPALLPYVRSTPTATVYVAETWRLPTQEHVVALTFDAGANADGIPSILLTLKAKGVPATFFLTGAWARRYPDDARAVAARYPLGNHTFSHPRLTEMSDPSVRNEISTGREAIRRVTDQDPSTRFRFPYGASDVHRVVLAESMGYRCYRWTIDTLGWEGAAAGRSSDSVRERVLAGLTPGAIVVMHVGSAPDHSTLDADALARVIDDLGARGYGFVALP